MNDTKYLLAYTIPLSSIIGLQVGGVWSFTTVLYAFGLIPLWEAFLEPDQSKLSEEKIKNRLSNRFFDLMLYLNLIIVFAILIFGIKHLTTQTLATYEKVGLVLSFGIVLGTNGINVAHELGHRKTKWERFLAKVLLMPAFYMHFYIEHNFGHHLNVGTPSDPATSKKNQSVFSFWFTSITGQIKNAIRIQKNLLKNKKVRFFSIYNDFFYYQIFQLAFLISIYIFLALKVSFFLYVLHLLEYFC